MLQKNPLLALRQVICTTARKHGLSQVTGLWKLLDLSVFTSNVLRLYAPFERHKQEVANYFDYFAMIAPVGIAWQAVQYGSIWALSSL